MSFARVAAFGGALGIGAFGALALSQKPASADSGAVGTTSCLKRFRTFASGMEAGSSFMTFNDFVVSLCRGQPPENQADAARAAKKATTKELHRLFGLFDANADNKLSYEEFCVLYTLLSTPARNFKTAFHMFDKDRTGDVNAAQFVRLMTSMSADPTSRLDLGSKSGLMNHFFGTDRKRVLRYGDFVKAVRRLRLELLRTEFNMADTTGKGMTIGQLRRLIYHKADAEMETKAAADAARAKGSSGGEGADGGDAAASSSSKRRGKKDKSKEKRKQKPAVAAGPVCSQDDYVKVLDVLHDAPTWMRALEIYQDAHGGSDEASVCDRDAFARALATTERAVTPREIELMFRLFDADDSGTLEPEELEDIVAARQTFFSKHTPDFLEPRRNAVQKFMHCMQQK